MNVRRGASREDQGRGGTDARRPPYVQTGAPQNYLLAIALGVILLVIGGIIR